MYVCYATLSVSSQESVVAIEKQYKHILALMKEKQSIMERDRALSERETTLRLSSTTCTTCDVPLLCVYSVPCVQCVVLVVDTHCSTCV